MLVVTYTKCLIHERLLIVFRFQGTDMRLTETAEEVLVERFRAILADKEIDDSQPTVSLYTQDISGSGLRCLAVISPRSIEALARVATLCGEARIAMFPRGAGLSYTQAYVPSMPRSVVIDLASLDQIERINADDMYVTVQAGVTWAALDAALAPHGLRTPFWGPLSGVESTVGGAMSQNAVWWGSGLHGTAVDSVLSFDIVTPDGTIVSTGSAGGTDGTPFCRSYGPDTTGLFGHDAGALGIKARVTLRLIRRPNANRFVSHSFETARAAFDAISTIGREQLASENFGFDPVLTAINVVEDDGDLARDLGKLFKVARAGGLMGAARVAIAGRRFAKTMDFGHHAIIEDHSEAGAEDRLARVRAICAEFGGTEVEASIPRMARADPFPPVAPAVLRAKGERWLPRHAMVPHSRAKDLLARFEAIIDAHAEDAARLKIRIGWLCCTVSSTIFLIEPQCIWPDAHGALHSRIVGEKVARKLPVLADNPEARALVDRILGAFVEAASALGAAHLQIGKVYPLRATRTPAAGALMDTIKAALDPHHLMNPGALGL
jgi:FAD/FMN-containing dehydrogenase